MSWWAKAAAGVALLAVGFVGGLVVGQGPPPENATAPEQAAVSTDDAPQPDAQDPRSERAPSGARERERERPSTTGSGLAVPVGNGVITASVRTTGGEVLPGVRVVLEARSEAMPGYTRGTVESILDRDPEELIASYAASVRWRQATRVEATTDAGGMVRFERLPPLTYGVYAVRDGYDIVRSGRHGPIAAGDDVELLARPIVTLTLDVRLPDGSQPELANISCKQISATRSYSWRPELREIRVAPGPHEVTVTADDHLAELSVELVEGGRPDVIRIDLEPRPGLRVTLSASNGVLPEAAYVSIARLRPGAELGPSAFASAEYTHHIQPRRSAEVTQWDLPAGEYAVGCSFAWNHPPEPIVMERVVVGESLAETELILPAFDDSNTLPVRVVDAAGEPVPEIHLGLKVVRGNSTHSGGATVVERRDGIHRVVRPRSPFDRAVLRATHPRYGTYEVEFGPQQMGVLTVTLRDPARVRVRVPGLTESPYADRLNTQVVAAADQPRSSRRPSREKVERDGDTFAEKLVAPGRYRVLLKLRQDRWRVTTIASAEFELDSGERVVSIALPALYELRVTGPTDSAGQSIHLSRKLRDEGQGEQWTSAGRVILPESGPAVIDGLPAGRYRVQLDGGPESREIQLPGEHDVRF